VSATHTSRTGKTYYLHTGPKRGGGTQHCLSTKAAGPMADHVPEGFEIHETVNGQVFLRRQPRQLIREDELDLIRRPQAQPRAGMRYQVEAQGKVVIIHEASDNLRLMRETARHLSVREQERIAEQFAHYQTVMRFTLLDAERRWFAPERFCFRGSVDDWISIGAPGPLAGLAGPYLKHLGQESLYELF
jgi:hypothetical protein